MVMEKDAAHLSDANAQHKEVVKAVYDKWLGPGNEVRCNEGIAAKAAISACASMENLPQSVSPSGEMFGVPGKALSDRAGEKYGGAAPQSKGPMGKKMSVTKSSMSDR